MLLHALRMVNFRQHTDTSIQFGRGVTGIIGPNGAGKSTILEAIAWALYGTPAARGTRDSIRSYRPIGRGTVSVELDFELGGHRYRVVRGLTNAELYLDGGEAPIATSLSTVTEVIRRRVGMTLAEFFNTYFTGQKELSIMAAMGPSERAQFLSRVLGYDRLRVAQRLARDNRKVVAAEASGLRSAVPEEDVIDRQHAEATTHLVAARAAAQAAAGLQESAQRTLDALTPRWESMRAQRELVQAITNDIRLRESERAALERDLERVARDWLAIDTARVELQQVRSELEPLAQWRDEAATLERLARADVLRTALSQEEQSLSADLLRLSERKAQLETAPHLEAQGSAELLRLRAELDPTILRFDVANTEWIRERQEAETKVAQLKRELADVRKQRDQLIELGDDGTCPMCERPLGDHLRVVLDLLEEQEEEIVTNGKYYRSRVTQLLEPPPPLVALRERREQLDAEIRRQEQRQQRIREAVVELTGVVRELEEKSARRDQKVRELAVVPAGYDATRHATVSLWIARVQPLEARAAALGAQIEREPQLSSERTALQQRLQSAMETIGAHEEQRARIGFVEEIFVALGAEHDSGVAALRAAELANVSAGADVRTAEAALVAAERDRATAATMRRRLAALAREQRTHDALDRAYNELRTDLNQQVRPEISELASQFLADLSDGRYSELELDDSYQITVLEDGIPKPVISGGEEDLANLVLRLAISQMIAERAGQPLSLLILDEIFGSLDESKRHNVLDLLRRLQDRFEQVILITHVESVREGLDRILIVRYDEDRGASRVEQEIRNEDLPAERDLFDIASSSAAAD